MKKRGGVSSSQGAESSGETKNNGKVDIKVSFYNFYLRIKESFQEIVLHKHFEYHNYCSGKFSILHGPLLILLMHVIMPFMHRTIVLNSLV